MHKILFAGTPYQIYAWDFCVIAGFIVVTALAVIKRPDKFPLSRISILAASLLMLFFGLAGGKLLSIYLHHEEFRRISSSFGQPLMAVSGYAFLGGLFFSLLTLVAFTKLQ